MKLMLRFAIPVERGNEAFATGHLGTAIEKLLADTKAEAAYFTLVDGERGGMLFFDEEDGARIPRIVEPFFAALDADIEIVPVITPEELRRGLSAGA